MLLRKCALFNVERMLQSLLAFKECNVYIKNIRSLIICSVKRVKIHSTQYKIFIKIPLSLLFPNIGFLFLEPSSVVIYPTVLYAYISKLGIQLTLNSEGVLTPRYSQICILLLTPPKLKLFLSIFWGWFREPLRIPEGTDRCSSPLCKMASISAYSRPSASADS